MHDKVPEIEDPMLHVPDDVLGDNLQGVDFRNANLHFEGLSELMEDGNYMIGDYYNSSMLHFNGSHNESFGNVSDGAMPREMTFSSDNMVSVIAYSCMFVISASGNLTVFITLFRTRGIKSRVNTFIMHLAIADLIVALIMLPLETAWHITVAWLAGDIACRILMFCRAFGFYLSSFVLVTISLDRYFSIVHPLSIHDADRRAKMLLTFAWVLSTVSSIPQSVIFHVERHPHFPQFEQCVTFNFFPTPEHELAYNLFNMIAVYLLPLLVITTTYACILWTISKNARRREDECWIRPEIGSTSSNANRKPSTKRSLLRCSSGGRIGKAKIRTLKMTLVIVSAFIICWTPYFCMSAIWWFDKVSAQRVDSKIQRGLFMFAVSNSCINPIFYGMFTTAFRREASRWKDWFKVRLSSMGILNSTQNSTVEHEYLG